MHFCPEEYIFLMKINLIFYTWNQCILCNNWRNLVTVKPSEVCQKLQVVYSGSSVPAVLFKLCVGSVEYLKWHNGNIGTSEKNRTMQ